MRYAVDTEAFAVPVQQVSSAVDADFVLVLTRDSRLLAFGENYHDAAIPPAAPPAESYIRADATGEPIAVSSAGQLVQWTDFWIGGTPPSGPPTLPAGMRWLDVASTHHRSFALRSDGALLSWGTTGQGGLEVVPTLAPGLSYESVAAGQHFVTASVSDGTVRVWGLNVSNVQSVPALPAGLAYTKVLAGREHIVALRSDGQLVVWGNNFFGQCNVPALPAGLQWLDAAAGGGHTLGLRSDGQWLAWGHNNHGQCDVPTVPVGTYRTVVAGLQHTVALRHDGYIDVWGIFQTPPRQLHGITYRDLDASMAGALVTNSDGTLGTVLGVGGAQQPPVLPAGVRYIAGSVGYDFSLGLGSDGQIRAWGSNVHGQLAVPALPTGTIYTLIDAGSQTAVALRSDGVAVAWGLNSFGQTAIPVLPPGESYVDASAGLHNVVLLRSDGDVVVTATGPLSPISAAPALPGTLRYTAVACGATVAAAIRSDGAIVSWGSAPSVVPPLPAGLSYVEVACAFDHAVARRSDGAVVTWGYPLYATTVPAPGPGRAYLRIAATVESSAGLIGMRSRYVPIAPGCAGSMPASRLVPRDTPQVGRNMPVLVTNLPIGTALVVFGWSQLLPPASLAPLGMVGCTAYVSLDAAVVAVGTASEASLDIAIPFHPALRGVTFFNQALVLDPTAGNPLGAVVSEAMVATIGG